MASNRARHDAVGFVVLVVLVAFAAACVDDRSADLVGSGGVCGSAAEMTEVLIDAGGEPADDGSLVEAIDAFATAAETDEDLGSVSLTQVAALADRGGDMSTQERATWYDDLARLDDAVAERCGFSMRVLIADAAAQTAASDAPDDTETPDEVEGGPLDWAGVLRRVPEAAWAARGYGGDVGVGPGVYVTVFGVPSEAEAVVVCTDVLAALAPEAAVGSVRVEVRGLGDHLLARSRDARCVGASGADSFAAPDDAGGASS